MATKPTSVLITDRTAADVANRTPKGFNNLSDVTRVQDWVNYFIDEINPSLEKWYWSQYERVDKSKWEKYILNNITELLKSYPDLSITVPTADVWDWQKQNQLENILLTMSTAEYIKRPTSFATDDWSVIESAVKNGSASLVYHIGDTRQERLEDGSTVTLKLRSFTGLPDPDYPYSGGTDPNKITISLADNTQETYQMFSNNRAEEDDLFYSKSIMHTTTLPEIYEKFSEKLKNVVKKVKCSMGYNERSVSTIESYLFLPSQKYPNVGDEINIDDTSSTIWLSDCKVSHYMGTLYDIQFYTNKHVTGIPSQYNLQDADDFLPIQWFFCV